jgi:23S rRNA pseudouridine1911/1915/1917 synthase
LEVPEGHVRIELLVPPDRDGWRLDRFLCWKIPRLSRTRAQRIIREQASTLEGKPLRPNHIVRAGERFRIVRPAPPEPDHPTEVPTLYEDEHLLVLDKPALLAVHPTARYFKGTVTSILRARYGDARPRITHRLDRETSGILVCARTRSAERSVKRQFEERRVHKEYLAIVRGVPAWDETVVDVPLRPAETGRLRVRMEVAPAGLGLAARTHVRVVERVQGAALVVASPETGRQHQIRVHLAAAGFPVVADKLYAHDEAHFLDYYEDGMTDALLAEYGLARQALHAHRLALTHPATGEPLLVESPLPEDLRTYLDARR